MHENCSHKPDIRCAGFLKQYFKKDGILTQTFRCRLCGGDIRFIKKPAHRLWDALIWVLLLAFMLGVRLARDAAIAAMPLWLYILFAVVAVSLLGLGLDMAKEWLLLKTGQYRSAVEESAGPEAEKEAPAK